MKKSELQHLEFLRNSVEELDGTCFFPGETEKALREFKKSNIEARKKAAEAKAKRNKKYYMFIDATDYLDDPMLLMDSIVDACCTQGCVVEPDGYCEHGHPSVLLANGMI